MDIAGISWNQVRALFFLIKVYHTRSWGSALVRTTALSVSTQQCSTLKKTNSLGLYCALPDQWSKCVGASDHCLFIRLLKKPLSYDASLYPLIHSLMLTHIVWALICAQKLDVIQDQQLSLRYTHWQICPLTFCVPRTLSILHPCSTNNKLLCFNIFNF